MGGLKYFKQVTNVVHFFFLFKRMVAQHLGGRLWHTDLEYDTTELHSDPVPKRNKKIERWEEKWRAEGHWCVYKWNNYVPTSTLKQASKSSPKRAKPKIRWPTRSSHNKTLAFSYWLLGCKSVNCTGMMAIALVITCGFPDSSNVLWGSQEATVRSHMEASQPLSQQRLWLLVKMNPSIVKLHRFCPTLYSLRTTETRLKI